MMEIFFIIGMILHSATADNEIRLPEPQRIGKITLEETLDKRRSVRSYSKKPISLKELSQLLWAAQGITSKDGLRTSPSAGALYPLEIFVVIGNVENLDAGVYRYIPSNHSIKKTSTGDKRKLLADAALGQEQIQTASVNIIIAAVHKRTTWKYGERGHRYVYMEVGHSAQNVLLQAEALGLGVCPIGAFYDEKVKKTLGLIEEDPIYILSVGRK